MSLLDTVYEKLGQGFDHVQGAFDKLMSTEVSYEAPKQNPMVANVASAIANNETGGVKGDPYAFNQPSGSSTQGKAIGKYQVTEGELKSWGKEFLGKSVDVKQFQKDPALQDEYMNKKIQTLLDAGATTDEVLALHRGGLTGYADPAIRQKRVAERKGYVDNGVAYLKTLVDNVSK